MQLLNVLSLVLIFGCAACSSGDDDDTTGASGSGGASGSTSNSGGSGGASHETSGGTSGHDDKPDAGDVADANTTDVGKDAGEAMKDGGDGPLDGGDIDASTGLNGMGSCCAEHDTPGCGNADLQVCVCELQPACCTEAWSAQCVFMVEQKYCQPGVRDCVCGDQWKQTDCCNVRWGDSCDSLAEIKCGAVPGCF